MTIYQCKVHCALAAPLRAAKELRKTLYAAALHPAPQSGISGLRPPIGGGGLRPAMRHTTAPVLDPKTAFDICGPEISEYTYCKLYLKVTDCVTGMTSILLVWCQCEYHAITEQ